MDTDEQKHPSDLITRSTHNGTLYIGDYFFYRTQSQIENILNLSKQFILSLSKDVVIILEDNIRFKVLLQTIANKAFESLDTMLLLCKNERSFFAISLLRAMCEELIFLRYFRALPRELVEEYLTQRSHCEQFESQLAQERYFRLHEHENSDVQRESSTSRLATFRYLEDKIDQQKNLLKQMGFELGWGRKPAPDVKFMAEKTNSLKIYQFYYHATSNAVHANVFELTRLIWGKPIDGTNTGSFSFSTKNYDKHYFKVALIYGAKIYGEIINIATEEFPDLWVVTNLSAFKSVVADVTKYPPPIVGEKELKWPPE